MKDPLIYIPYLLLDKPEINQYCNNPKIQTRISHNSLECTIVDYFILHLKHSYGTFTWKSEPMSDCVSLHAPSFQFYASINQSVMETIKMNVLQFKSPMSILFLTLIGLHRSITAYLLFVGNVLEKV